MRSFGYAIGDKVVEGVVGTGQVVVGSNVNHKLNISLVNICNCNFHIVQVFVIICQIKT